VVFGYYIVLNLFLVVLIDTYKHYSDKVGRRVVSHRIVTSAGGSEALG
jgi:hypothetical protein